MKFFFVASLDKKFSKGIQQVGPKNLKMMKLKSIELPERVILNESSSFDLLPRGA